MNTDLDQKIKKLPVWAQGHIDDIERQRLMAVHTLNEMLDAQTVSSFYYDDLVCTGENQGPTFKRKYIQTNRMTVDFAGVELSILLRQDSKNIELSWADQQRHSGEVALIPISFGRVAISTKENMRS